VIFSHREARYTAAAVRGVLGLALLLAVQQAGSQTVIQVDSASELHQAVEAANSAGGNRTISLADGTYSLNDTLYINAANITLEGASGDPELVTIQGDAMSSSASIGNVIRVAGDNFALRGITLQKSRYHLIQIAGEADADSPHISNCIMRDAYEQLIKVSVDEGNLSVSSDGGIVENCLFEYTAGIGPQYYIGGIDAHAAKNWIIRDNIFRNIISPSAAVAEFAVHFWNDSQNNLVERNLIINCDRGIGFGLGSRGNSGGIIRNNMIYHSSGNGQYADTGISLENSSGSEVYNNTIFLEHAYPWAIEYRFSGTSGVSITNNLTNRTISSRDGGNASLDSNLTNAVSSWFVAASAGDLHLATDVAAIVDQGVAVSGLSDDFDGDARPAGGGIDIGADELGASALPRSPDNLTVL
jgi:hypothetical protein